MIKTLATSPSVDMVLPVICSSSKDRWFFGRNNTGDIFNRAELFENNAHVEFDLVTSDGGFDCSADPAAQEANSGELKIAEYQAICHKLAPNGSGVLKMFNCCHETSLKILESAANSFQSVNLGTFYGQRAHDPGR